MFLAQSNNNILPFINKVALDKCVNKQMVNHVRSLKTDGVLYNCTQCDKTSTYKKCSAQTYSTNTLFTGQNLLFTCTVCIAHLQTSHIKFSGREMHFINTHLDFINRYYISISISMVQEIFVQRVGSFSSGGVINTLPLIVSALINI